MATLPVTDQSAPVASAPWFARISGRLGHRAVPDAIDYLIAAGCFAAFTLPVLAGPATSIGSRAAVAGFGILAAAPLIFRRQWPIATVAAIGAVYLVATLAGVRFTPFVSNAGPNVAIAAFTAADRCDRRSSLTATVIVGLATWAVLAAGVRLYPGQGQDAVQLAAAIPAWLAGDMVRVRRLYRRQLEFETAQRVAEQERRARAEERLRLSADVHDVVSHSLSMIAVRSGVARLLLDEQPGEARATLAAIEAASRSALDELRHLLRQIRDPEDASEVAMPTLDDLPELVARLREAGLDLSYQCTGQPGAYSAATALSTYRIAQEALTNVVKHAPAAHARLEIMHSQSELIITVTDDGPGQLAPGARSPGFGIVGMRERAAMLGGEFTAGPRPEGGFAVVARLPTVGCQ